MYFFDKIEAHLDSLINEQAYHILTKTDLLDAYKIIQNHDTKARGPLVNVLGMDSNTLKSAMVCTKFKSSNFRLQFKVNLNFLKG